VPGAPLRWTRRVKAASLADNSVCSAAGQAYGWFVALSYPDPVLGDDVLVLRPWSLHDLGCVREASTDPSIPSSTTVPSSWTIEAGAEFIDRQRRRIESGEGVSLAVHAFDAGCAVGLVSLMLRPQPGVIGLGYWIVPNARHQGFARRAATRASDWAIGPGGFARIEAWVAPHNESSRSVLSAAGFEMEGRLRSFLTIGDSRSDAGYVTRHCVRSMSTPSGSTSRLRWWRLHGATIPTSVSRSAR
jgi:ribosomal-protein-alanine N-acetyltransferase